MYMAPAPFYCPLDILAREILLSTAFERRGFSPTSTTTTTTTTLNMRTLGWSFTLSTLVLLFLSWATQSVEAWVWGPYNAEWKDHREAASQPLMYRIVLPRNGTAPSFSSGNGTYNTRANATGSGRVPLSTSTTKSPSLTNSSGLDTSCGVTSPLFPLQVSGADGAAFNKWWLKLSGNSILFTPKREKATGFGVNSATQHLCVPAQQTGRLPLIAIVETRLDTGPLYFLDANFSQNYEPEYEPITCNTVAGNGSQLACASGSGNVWSGCGLQLELGSGQSTNGVLNCSSISLNAMSA